MDKKSEEEVICLSQMTAKKGKEKQLKQALLALALLSRQEPDYLMYELWQEQDEELSFVVYERFRSQEALQKYISMHYIQVFMKNEYITCVESHWDKDFRLIQNSIE